MNLRKGISPVIATVIIVAVALAIAIAVVGWIMGIWGAVTGGTEILKIMPYSKLYNGNSTESNKYNVTVVLYIKNEGGASATITKVEVVGICTINVTASVPPGKEVKVSANKTGLDVGVTPGAIYTIKVYTSTGNVYTTQLTAEEAPA